MTPLGGKGAGPGVMGKLTITLDDKMHHALIEASERLCRSSDALVEESLQLRGIKPVEEARALVRRARAQAGLSATKAAEVADKQARNTRRRRRT